MLWKVRNTGAAGFIAQLVVAIAVIYAVLLIFYGKSSVIAVNDVHIGGVVLGLAILGHRLFILDLQGSWQDKMKALGVMILTMALGGGLIWMTGRMLYLDFLSPRLVIEGRVEKPRTSGSRRTDYLVDIGGRTVKVTAPLYERLEKFRPIVRVEVGRGSNYVYDIEYLAN
ncbi:MULTISPECIES: hypothetical protein [unclassified Bradyrhizobium]|uniref:hypothetical protein n=1 Tax=unclassified Bradyrhizobium TaxID=2631580 RepID=UPI001FE0951D|nr:MULTISPECIES: hypothetical protein [unclassified Bradyrhizobium]